MQEKTLATYKGTVWNIAFRPDGEILASQIGSSEVNIRLWRQVRLWDVVKEQDLKTLAGHTYGILSVAFSPDAQTLATGGSDSIVLLWDLTDILSATDDEK